MAMVDMADFTDGDWQLFAGAEGEPRIGSLDVLDEPHVYEAIVIADATGVSIMYDDADENCVVLSYRCCNCSAYKFASALPDEADINFLKELGFEVL